MRNLKLRGRDDGYNYFTTGSILWGPTDRNFHFFKLCCCFSKPKREVNNSKLNVSNFKLAFTNNTKKIHGCHHGNKEVARKSRKFAHVEVILIACYMFYNYTCIFSHLLLSATLLCNTLCNFGYIKVFCNGSCYFVEAQSTVQSQSSKENDE